MAIHTPPPNLDMWVLAGQSNMQGCARLSGALLPDDRVWSFTSAGKWEIAQEPLHQLWESFTPVHQRLMRETWVSEDTLSDEEYARQEDETRVVGAGLGLSFGIAMADALGQPIGLIPAAHGGTSLDQWNPALKCEGGNSLYGAMLERIEYAGGRLRGVLWYQGESDATPELSRSYSQRFADWVTALRNDVHQPELPVIAVQIGRFVVPPNNSWPKDWAASCDWERVREAELTLPETVSNTAVTSAIDLGLKDVIHVNTTGLIRLGRRMARLALHLTGKPEIPAGPRIERIEYLDSYGEADALRVVCSGVVGGWNPRHTIRGFSAHTSDNEPHKTIAVVNADALDSDPTSIRILLSGKLDDTVRLGYGMGLDPCCNTVDEADMPLCAFMPRGIS